MRHLCISVCFLDPLFHGQRDEELREWPPSPMRLFQSLLAGSHAGCRKIEWSDAKAAAFRWLEQRNPPVIVAPQVHAAAGYTFYVPDNDGDDEPNRQNRLKGKVALPHRMLDGQTLHYLWRIEDSEWDVVEAHSHTLASEARNLLALGWGIDMVAGYGHVLSSAEADALVGERWLPYEVGSTMGTTPSHVPVENTLDNLVEVYQANVNRLKNSGFGQLSKPSVFRSVHYLRQTRLPQRSWTVFALTGVTDDSPRPAFRQEDIAQVAGMLRHVAYDKAKRDQGFEFPGGADFHVAGHRTNDDQVTQRFAYLPLPSIGHLKSDGKIRRVLIAGSYDSDSTQTRWAEQRLRGAELIGERTQKAIAALATPTNNDPVVRLYTGLSASWVTVTPVTLPGFDEGNYKKALGLMAKAIVQSGISLDAIADVTLRTAPFWPGSQHPAQYFRPKYLKQHASWHAHLRFHEQVYGPLAVGSGRFCGLGLFAPMNS